MQQTFQNALKLFRISTVLPALFVALVFSSNLYAQKPVGGAPPDSILTGDRRKAEELRKKQEEELARESAIRRQDSLRAAEQEQATIIAKAREQSRQDSIKAAERIADEERQRLKLMTPVAWKAIGIGGSVGIGNMQMILAKPSLTATSVLATDIHASSAITRRLDLELSFGHMLIGDDFPGDSVYNYGSGSHSTFKYTRANYRPGARYVLGEDISINSINLEAHYTFNQPSAIIRFYLGIGYSHLSMTNRQQYASITDTLTLGSEGTEEGTFSRGALKLMFGLKHDFELGGGFTLTPFAQIGALGAFSGEAQAPSFVIRPDAEQIIATNVKAGFTLYYGWFGVTRER